MFFKFFLNEHNFFDLFEKQVSYAVDAAGYFKELVSNSVIDETAINKMHEIEHQGDEIAHTIIDQLNKTFVTPFDREDIFALVKEIDNIIDMIYTIVNRLKVYKLTEVNKNIVGFASVIEESVCAVASAVKGMLGKKNVKSVLTLCVEIHRLENIGDVMRDRMLGELFETETNPITVIKWKEIYEYSEIVLDICEDVANVVETILVKQA
jgi:hypothetical protein